MKTRIWDRQICIKSNQNSDMNKIKKKTRKICIHISAYKLSNFMNDKYQWMLAISLRLCGEWCVHIWQSEQHH